MANVFFSAAFTTAMALAGGRVWAGEALRPAVTVIVYDYTSIPDAVLKRMRDDVSRIFGESGIEVRWIGVASKDSLTVFAIQILIKRQAAPASSSASTAAMGASLGDSHTVGGIAMLFRDRITHVALDGHQDVARLLAYAMAHEIGHMLLPYPAHAAAGIMHAPWDGDDLQHISGRTLKFSAAEIVLLRAKAAGCCPWQFVVHGK